MTERVVTTSRGPLRGVVRVPGDKSLSHRAVLFASMARGQSALAGVLDSEDVRSTIAACTALGALVDTGESDGTVFPLVRVTGWGAHGPSAPGRALDCGNSGTTVRLIMGVLAGWPMDVTLVGDESLSGRPMRRVTDPLSRMGAAFETTADGTLPVTVRGVGGLQPLTYASPVASAQVKSAVLLAGLRARGTTRVTEPALSRDHTERLLPAFGVPVVADDAPGASVRGPAVLTAADVSIPGDPSSAAFFAVAAAIVEGSRVEMPGVSLNPTRTGFLSVLRRMGADIRVHEGAAAGLEPVGTLVVSGTTALTSTTVRAGEVPSLVDEIPVLAVAAACARGTTRFEGVGELRVKESDRLEAVSNGLGAFGVRCRSGRDWLEVDGATSLSGATLGSLGDHRLAMTWAVAGLVASSPTTISGWEACAVSYPSFGSELDRLVGG